MRNREPQHTSTTTSIHTSPITLLLHPPTQLFCTHPPHAIHYTPNTKYPCHIHLTDPSYTHYTSIIHNTPVTNSLHTHHTLITTTTNTPKPSHTHTITTTITHSPHSPPSHYLSSAHITHKLHLLHLLHIHYSQHTYYTFTSFYTCITPTPYLLHTQSTDAHLLYIHSTHTITRCLLLHGHPKTSYIHHTFHPHLDHTSHTVQ